MVFLPNFLVLFTLFAVSRAFREATDEEFPFQVSIKTLDNRHLCGGAIITPKWILTVSPCLRNQAYVRVSYGSADSNIPLGSSESHKIEHQNSLNIFKKNRLALIQLQTPIEFSKTVRQASLPTLKAQQFPNITKLSAWKVDQTVNIPPNLYVIDNYYPITADCKTSAGMPVTLDDDEFCGMEDNYQNRWLNLGSTVSKRGIVVGILPESLISPNQPNIFVKVSQHSQWIKDVLKSDAEYLKWEDAIPKDSAPSNSLISFALMGISVILIRLI